MSLWYSVPGYFMALFAVTGNGMVISLIAKKHRLHTTANWFILSLAVADFSLGILYFPFSFVCPIGEIICSEKKIFQALPKFLFYASALNLWAMTFDRYIAVVKPLRYMALLTTRRVLAIIAMVWLFSLLLGAAEILIPVLVEPGYMPTTMKMFNGIRRTALVSCAVFLVFATGHVLFITRKHSRQIAAMVVQLNFNQPHSAPAITVKASAQESSSAKLITTVVVVNVSCFIASVFIYCCAGVHPCNLVSMRVAGALLLVANSAINPVIYALLKRDIRGELKRAFSRSVGVQN